MTRATYIALHVVPIVLLVAAPALWPYGFYVVLRLVVCVAAAWLAVEHYKRYGGRGWWVVVLGVGALIFNPLIPVHLTRGIWFFIDLTMAAIFGVHLWKMRAPRGESTG